tara:strand:- start:649 stop:921 length:273 start_codon:yes stop_codon:yes gene_type:complete
MKERFDMKNLGTANGWKETPAEYTRHLAECGTEYETTICYMEYPEEGGCIKRQRQEMARRYDMTVTRKGNCYHNHTCNECGISYDVDSSG